MFIFFLSLTIVSELPHTSTRQNHTKNAFVTHDRSLKQPLLSSLSYQLITLTVLLHLSFTHSLHLCPLCFSLLYSVRPVSFGSPPLSSCPSPNMAAWDLSVIVEDLGPDAPAVTLSVTSDLHIGGVILKLVEKTRRSPSSLSASVCLSHPLNDRLSPPFLSVEKKDIKIKKRCGVLLPPLFCIFSSSFSNVSIFS